MEYIFNYSDSQNKISVDSIMDLSKILREQRPNISDSTIKTYKSCLTTLFKKCFGNDEDMTLHKFNETDKIIKMLSDEGLNTKKTKLAALVVLTGNDSYLKEMLQFIKEKKTIDLKQEKTPSQIENMIGLDEVDYIYKNLENHAKIHLANKNISEHNLNEVQKWILLCLTSGLFIPPRRSADWNMKWKNYDEEKDNYVDVKNSQFVFNNYKTAKVYGMVKIDIPKSLKLILNKWFKINPTDYILFDSKKQPLTSPQIAHRLNDIFGKKISTSMLRHIYLTHRFGDVNLQEINDTAAAMGTSKIEALQYVKN